MLMAWMQARIVLYIIALSQQMVCWQPQKRFLHPSHTVCFEGANLTKGKAGSNPVVRTWAYGGFVFPRLCQRPKRSDLHQTIRRLPAEAIMAGAHHSESGSSVKVIAKPMTIGVKNVDDNWCSVVYNALSEYSAVGSLSAASTRRHGLRQQPHQSFKRLGALDFSDARMKSLHQHLRDTPGRQMWESIFEVASNPEQDRLRRLPNHV